MGEAGSTRRVLAEFAYDEGTGEQTLARYFVDGPVYVDEHVLMCDVGDPGDPGDDVDY